jgi:hypothetical protein
MGDALPTYASAAQYACQDAWDISGLSPASTDHCIPFVLGYGIATIRLPTPFPDLCTLPRLASSCWRLMCVWRQAWPSRPCAATHSLGGHQHSYQSRAVVLLALGLWHQCIVWQPCMPQQLCTGVICTSAPLADCVVKLAAVQQHSLQQLGSG